MTSESKVVSLSLVRKQHEKVRIASEFCIQHSRLTDILWHQWEVEPLGNGRCTIKSVSAGSYLGWETGNDGVTKVVKTNLQKEWIVKRIGLSGYTYLQVFRCTSLDYALLTPAPPNFDRITTSDKPCDTTQDIALTNGDTSEV